MNKHKFIDLFAGCGGLSLGLEQAGFYPLHVNEINKDALGSYLVNRTRSFPHLQKSFSFDIKELVRDDIQLNFFKNQQVDIVCGGPPCQGFSNVGIRRSYSVEKKQMPSNHLFEDMAYIIHKIRPKVFLFENVEGLMRSKWTKLGENGEIFHDILTTFRNVPGYSVKYKLLYAKDYGVPQRRPRIIIVGIRDGLINSESNTDDAVEAGYLPPPNSNPPNLIDVLSDIEDIDFEYGNETLRYVHPVKSSFQRYLRTRPDGSVARKGDRLNEHQYSKHSDRIIQKFKASIENDGVIPDVYKTKKFAQRVLPRKWTDKGPNLTITSLPDDFIHYSQPRSLTVREWARIQTFPDWYLFVGKRTTGGIRRAGNPRENIFEREAPKYTQIGNAVPVKMAKAIGLHLKEKLTG